MRSWPAGVTTGAIPLPLRRCDLLQIVPGLRRLDAVLREHLLVVVDDDRVGDDGHRDGLAVDGEQLEAFGQKLSLNSLSCSKNLFIEMTPPLFR